MYHLKLLKVKINTVNILCIIKSPTDHSISCRREKRVILGLCSLNEQCEIGARAWNMLNNFFSTILARLKWNSLRIQNIVFTFIKLMRFSLIKNSCKEYKFEMQLHIPLFNWHNYWKTKALKVQPIEDIFWWHLKRVFYIHGFINKWAL